MCISGDSSLVSPSPRLVPGVFGSQPPPVVTALVVTMHGKTRRTVTDGQLLSTHVGLVPSSSNEGIEAILPSVESHFRQGP